MGFTLDYIVFDIIISFMDSATILKVARTKAGLSQHELARRAGTSQPAVARIERGLSSPSVDTLTRLLAAAGFELALSLRPRSAPDPVVESYKRDIDRTLLRENLRRSVDERLLALNSLSTLDSALRAATARRRRPRR